MELAIWRQELRYNLEQNRIEKQTPDLPSLNREMREPREGQNFPILNLGLGNGGWNFPSKIVRAANQFFIVSCEFRD